MAINQKQVLSLQQKLSPQQIQMIKLLELPTVQLEQRIKQEIEDNIVLEEEEHASIFRSWFHNVSNNDGWCTSLSVLCEVRLVVSRLRILFICSC